MTVFIFIVSVRGSIYYPVQLDLQPVFRRKRTKPSREGRIWKKSFVDPELTSEDPDGYYHLPGGNVT